MVEASEKCLHMPDHASLACCYSQVMVDIIYRNNSYATATATFAVPVRGFKLLEEAMIVVHHIMVSLQPKIAR